MRLLLLQRRRQGPGVTPGRYREKLLRFFSATISADRLGLCSSRVAVVADQFSFEGAVDSFANQLLNVQRQAETLLHGQAGADAAGGVQQSFLLRGGHFVGVRWEQGNWRAEWTFQGNELVLWCADRQQQRTVLPFPTAGQVAEVDRRRAA